jgi:DNA-binding response OmpR family regulator
MTTAGGERILVAEDDRDIRDIIVFKLGSAGYTVDTADDGLAAWEAFQAAPPHLAVLDIMMPRMSGIDLLRKIRQSDTPGVPVLLLSAKGRNADVDLGFAAGATDYMVKPFSPRELLDRVKGILGQEQ